MPCGICGEIGHNRRTCKKNFAVQEEKVRLKEEKEKEKDKAQKSYESKNRFPHYKSEDSLMEVKSPTLCEPFTEENGTLSKYNKCNYYTAPCMCYSEKKCKERMFRFKFLSEEYISSDGEIYTFMERDVMNKRDMMSKRNKLLE